MALSRTLNNIREKLGISHPTVIWSGNGFHIYLMLNSEGIILETIKEFTDPGLGIRLDQISIKFLRFVEWYLSDGKSDLQHNTTVSFNNSMMRVPGSINSKNNSQVRIVQDMKTANPVPIKPLLRDFRHYLIEQSLNEKHRQLKSKSKHSNSGEIWWIERLLETPLSDFRKYCIWRILAPYLLNIRKVSEKESYDIIANWLDQCSNLRRLDFNYNQKIGEGIEGAAKGYLPINREKLKKENPELFLKIS